MSTMSGSRSVIGPLDGVMVHPDRRNLDLIERKYKEVDEHGRLPHPWLTEKAQTDTDALAFVGVHSVWLNLQALTARDNKGETPIDIASRSGACAEIIGLLSLTPEEARSLGLKGVCRLYAPVTYWNNETSPPHPEYISSTPFPTLLQAPRDIRPLQHRIPVHQSYEIPKSNERGFLNKL